MTLEEVIRQRLAEATEQVAEAKKLEVKEPKEVESDPEDDSTDVVDLNPKKKSLCKEDLDAMTEEEINSIDEEQLDELSQTTLRSYVRAAKRDLKSKIVKPDVDPDDFYHAKHVDDSPEFANGVDPQKMLNRDNYIYHAEKKIKARTKPQNNLKEDTVSSQVSALLEAEGLSDEFKVQAVTIFEAAVTDRVLVLQEELQKEFDQQLAEAKAELDNDIDGFLSEAIQQWKQDNEVAIKSNFKSQLAESFMDGMRALIAEHNIEVPEDKEDALEVALGEVDKLNESIQAKQDEVLALQEQVNAMKSKQILESFKDKMTQTEFDRFVQLTESVKYVDEAQYEKQLKIVQDNFSVVSTKQVKVEPVVEQISESVQKIVTETNSNMDIYTKYLNRKQ